MRRTRCERGSAVIEVITVGLLLFVPVVWSLTVLAELHRAALATTAAARDAGFDAARADDRVAAALAIDAATRVALRDHGLDPALAAVAWSTPRSLARGASVRVRVGYPVEVLPAPLLGDVAAASIVIRAVHVAPIDRYSSR